MGHGGDWGSFHRIRYTGKPLGVPVAVNTRKEGIELHFDEPLGFESATNPENFSLSLWSYPWTSQYGTRRKVYSVLRPGETGADPVSIRSIQLSDDRKRLTLEIPEIRQSLARKSLGILPELPDLIDRPMGLVMAIDYSIRSASGSVLEQRIHKTIHNVAGDIDSVSETATAHSGHGNASPAPTGSSTRAAQPPPEIGERD